MGQPIQFRRGTAAEATAANEVLPVGMPGFETDTGLFKIGDGVTAWNSLPYAGGGTAAAADAGDFDAAGSAASAQAFAVQRANHTGTQAQSTVTDLTTDLAAKLEADDVAPLPTGGATGDLFIVRQTASGFEHVEITEDPA